MLTVLYEDQRQRPGTFGLHDFVCQLALDRSGLTMSVHNVRQRLVHAIPLKGNGNVRQRCRRDLANLRSKYAKVVAVYDEDKVSRLPGLPSAACRKKLCDHLKDECAPQSGLEIVLVRWNLEDVVRTLQASPETQSLSRELFERALSKQLPARDSIFIQCAQLPKANREQLLEQLPDVRRLVEIIAAELKSGAGT